MKRGKKKQEAMKKLVVGIEEVPVHNRRAVYFAEYRKNKPKRSTFELVADVVMELPAAVEIGFKSETEE